MKVPHALPNDRIAQLLADHYGLQANTIAFIPIGDMSYGYRVACSNGQDYYFKLLDRNMQPAAIERARMYLPVLHALQETRLFEQAVYPVLNLEEKFAVETEDIVGVLFPWVEGQTLADAHPFSEALVEQIAAQAAKLHQTTSTVVDLVQLPMEDYSLSFEQELNGCLDLLANDPHRLDRYGSELTAIVVPKENAIRSVFARIQALQLSFTSSTQQDYVLCHGDLWGGNMIQSSEGLIFIDWESVTWAPPEREMVGYLTQHLDRFVAAYNVASGRTFSPNIDLLRFYAFQAQLRNLTQWMMNILYRNREDAQQQNDLEMIQFHCLDRWDGIEAALAKLQN
ncbi:phosphotransferase family protein [Paenibacillus silvisoli]|uniref:phosphotransferase family protein n=1 Tax=Paenibacillus silvisoli TaxID=3110539 RepID=UPI0028061163|nr:phosphotransferase [Paenibacillus silvisoli]